MFIQRRFFNTVPKCGLYSYFLLTITRVAFRLFDELLFVNNPFLLIQFWTLYWFPSSFKLKSANDFFSSEKQKCTRYIYRNCYKTAWAGAAKSETCFFGWNRLTNHGMFINVNRCDRKSTLVSSSQKTKKRYKEGKLCAWRRKERK